MIRMHMSPPPSNRRQARAGTKVQPLPLQLLDHCTVCFEEQLFQQALSLLSSALTSGTGSPKPCYIPPPQHLALAITLVVHPQMTTRTTSDEKHAASDDALEFLRYVNLLLGPQAAGFSKAFCFNDRSVPARVKRVKSRQSLPAGDEDETQPGCIRSLYVDKESLWTNAQDFWSVVGWAFNCSVTNNHRWERWKLWLELMLDILERDLEVRIAECEKVNPMMLVGRDEEMSESLLASYLVSLGERRSNKRRMMRAILADGKHKSLAEFGEVWRHETKPPKEKPAESASKSRKLDFEKGHFGDYLDDDSQEDSPATSVSRSRSLTALSSTKQSRAVSDDDEDGDANADTDGSASNGVSAVQPVETFGGMDSVRLRQRLLALVVRFCIAEPVFLDTEDLFDLYTEFLRPLPLAVFQQFVLPTKGYLDCHAQSSLDQMLLRPLIEATAPPYDDNSLTQADFENHYAAYAANTAGAVDNAKVSLVVESLMRLLWSSGGLVYSSEIHRLVNKGIEARKAKIAFDGRRKTDIKAKEHEEAAIVLESSAKRMLAILDLIQ